MGGAIDENSQINDYDTEDVSNATYTVHDDCCLYIIFNSGSYGHGTSVKLNNTNNTNIFYSTRIPPSNYATNFGEQHTNYIGNFKKGTTLLVSHAIYNSMTSSTISHVTMREILN